MGHPNRWKHVLRLAVGHFGSLADARLDNSGLFGVEVMIVSTGAASTLELWQDLLVRTGGGGAVRAPDRWIGGRASLRRLVCRDAFPAVVSTHWAGITGILRN